MIELDKNQDYPELMKFYTLLNPNQPIMLNAASPSWVKECLKSTGWQDGDKVPTGLPDYVAAILDYFSLKATPENAQQVFALEEVQQTIGGALRRVYEKTHADDVAKAQTEALMGPDADMENPIIQKLYKSVVAAKEEELKQPVKVVSAVEATEMLKQQEPKEIMQAPVESQISYTHCPCCGISLQEEYKPSVISEEDHRNFLLYVMGSESFVKSYSLWNGAATAQLRIPTPEEEALFTEYYSKICTKAGVNARMDALLPHYQRGRLAITLDSILFTKPSARVVKAPSILSETYAPTEDKNRVEQFLDKWYTQNVRSMELQRELNKALDWNIQDITNLRRELNNPDFWNGGIID